MLGRPLIRLLDKRGDGIRRLSCARGDAALDIAMICPLHGFVWRRNIGDYIEKYLIISEFKLGIIFETLLVN